MENLLKSSQLPVVAVFDFDGTLTRRDSLLPFLRFAFGNWQFCWGILLISPFLLGYLLKLIPNWRAKQTLLIHFLSGQNEKKLNQIAQRFAVQEIPKLVHTEAINRLRWHQNQEHRIILLSASLEMYLLPWAKTMDFSEVLGTKIAVVDDHYTGYFISNNCYGEEKVKRLQELLGDLNQYCIHAYGDSRGDLPLLNLVTYPYYRTFEMLD